MKKFFTYFLAIAFAVSLFPNNAQAGDLNIFGFFQATAKHQNETQTMIPAAGGTESKKDWSSFDMQQANLFLQKTFGNGFGMFFNVELANNYNMQEEWGYFNLQEAYMTYYGSDLFQLKAGIFLPKFNSMYEMSNRTPLLPMIIRPLSYEAAYSDLLPPEDWTPQRALIQVNGVYPVADYFLEYAVYAGNAENSYLTSHSDEDKGPMDVGGFSEVSFKSVGTRVGFLADWAKIGFSANFDHDRANGIRIDHFFSDGLAPAVYYDFGDVSKTMIGADVQFNFFDFTLMGELIMVNHSLDDKQQAMLDEAVAVNETFTTGGISGFDHLFYYGLLQYNFTDGFYAYGMYQSLKQEKDRLLVKDDALSGFSVGAGYQLVDEVILKLQYLNSTLDGPVFEQKLDTFVAGISVSF